MRKVTIIEPKISIEENDRRIADMYKIAHEIALKLFSEGELVEGKDYIVLNR